MTIFDKTLAGYRFVRSHYGDSLQRLALRELGDAAQWTTIVALNKLQPPYLTDDPTQASEYVLLNGEGYIVVPAATAAASQPDPGAVFGVDIKLSPDGLLGTSGNDFQIVGGLDNLVQALENALATEQGELLFHPSYGTLIRRILGKTVGPTANQLAAEYAKTTVAADPRIAQVSSATATASGDSISVVVQAETVTGAIASASTST